MSANVFRPVVAPVHPRGMPVILTNEAEREARMTAPAEEALQRPLPDGMVEIVAAKKRMPTRPRRQH